MILAGGRAGRAEMDRFNAEAQAVAQLQHPNIVQVFEFGESSGQPFFSLEFVDGGTLEDKAGGNPQMPRHAARIVELLADAMDLAHRRGILHRDLKPANVLMEGAAGLQLDQYVPKITDFGLAKKLEGNSTQTRDGSVMGTPSYMAPEQAEGRIRELGPPADVYSLGAILYDLLTGGPPFRGTTVMDTLRQVINNEPVPPVHLQPGLPHDMQTICLKCLQKDPRKRYASAGELAADLRRYQNNQPILARATPAWERIWKWSRRHPTTAALIAVSVLALLTLGTGGFLYARLETRRAEEAHRLQDVAETNASEARTQEGIAKGERQRAENNARAERLAKDNEKLAKEAAEEQRSVAMESLHQAQQAIDTLTYVGQKRLANVPRLESLRREILETSLRFHQRFLATHGNQPSLRRDCALAQLRSADINEKLGYNYAAEDAYLAARKIFEALIRESLPGSPNDRRNLAVVWNCLGILRPKVRRMQEAEDAFREAIRIQYELVTEPILPQLSARTVGLLIALHEQGGISASAVLLSGKAIEFVNQADRERDLANSYNSRGTLYKTTNRPAEAEKDYRAALELLEPLAVRTGEEEDTIVLARTYSNLGVVLVDRQRDLANAVFNKALPLWLELNKNLPDDPDRREGLALAYLSRGSVRQLAGRPEAEVTADYEEARKLFESLAQEFPGFPEHRHNLAKILRNRGKFLFGAGRWLDAEKVYRQLVPLLTALVRESSDEPALQHELGDSYNYLGMTLGQMNQHADAEDAWREGWKVQERLIEKYPTNQMYWQDGIENRRNLAVLFILSKNADKAEKAVVQLVELNQRRVKAFPTELDYQSKLAEAWKLQSRVLLERGKKAAAREALEAAVATQRPVWIALRESPDMKRKLAERKALADYSKTLIPVLLMAGDHKAASAAVAVLQRDVPAEGTLPPGLSDRAAAVFFVRCFKLAENDAKLSEEYAGQALAALRRAAERDPREVADLKTAADFQPLRDREDFKKVVAEIEGKNGK